MERRDYLMRYFDQLGEVIARLIGFRKRKEWEHAHEHIDEVSNDFLGIDINNLKEIDSSEIVAYLIKTENFTLDKIKILAELLKEKGETYFQQLNVIDALVFFNHSITLHEFIDSEEKTFSLERNQKMEFIKERLSNIELN
jgi:hypothetical protein